MNKKEKRKQRPRTTPEERIALTPEKEEALRGAEDALRKDFPWFDAQPEEARRVAMRATFPRSVAGPKQDDQLLRRIYVIKQYGCEDAELVRLAIVETTNCIVAPRDPKEEELLTEELGKDEPSGSAYRLVDELGKMVSELHKLSDLGTPFQPKNDYEFFSLIAQDLKHLDTYKPRAGDYAVEALQKAFVGLMQSKYHWGKKGLPPKGDVRAMAEARLKEHGRRSDFSKAYWSELLQRAGFGDWLPAGHAGRPSKAALDENIKAERKCMALVNQELRKTHGTDWSATWDILRAARGGKSEYRRSELDRSAMPAQPKKRHQSE